jgi:hypothetical protein
VGREEEEAENDRAAYHRAQAKKVRVTAADYIVGSGKGAGGRRGSQSMTTTTMTATTSTSQPVHDEHKDEDDVIDLVGPQYLSPLLSPNSAIRATLARTPFAEQGLFA